MSRDFTMLGCGLVTGHLAWILVAQAVSIPSALIAAAGVFFIVGSRYGYFGKKRVLS